MNGQQLIADYKTALVTASTVQAAHEEAMRTETEITGYLQAASSGRYLQPGAISEDEQAGITRASLDAHFKKVQAQQIDNMGLAQLQQLAQQAQMTYAGKRVTATIRNNQPDVIEIVFVDPQQGEYFGRYNRSNVSGIIEEVLLDRNLLVLRPNVGVRLFNNRLQHYIVYIIDPATLEPLVDLFFS